MAKIFTASCMSRSKESRPNKSKRDTVNESIRNSLAIYDVVKELQGGDRDLVRMSMHAMHKAALRATRSIYGVVLLTLLPVLGVSLIALTISWNTISIELYAGMVEALMVLTVVFQTCFAVVACCVWDASQFAAFIDTAVCLIVPFANWYWLGHYERNGVLAAADIATFSLVIGYMTARAWSMTVKPRHKAWRANNCSGITCLERLEMVWATRSASHISEILPDINAIWDQLVALWGEENARAVCRTSIYVTDTDERAVSLLKHELLNLSLYHAGCIQFARPDFGEIIESHSLDMITTRRNSYSVLAFCGSPELASDLHQLKINNDMVVAITGSKKHQTEFVSESYGGTKGKKTKGAIFTRSTVSTAVDVQGDNTESDTSPDPGDLSPTAEPTGLTSRELTTFQADPDHDSLSDAM